VRFGNYVGGATTIQECQNGACYTVIGPVQVPAGTNYVEFKTPVGIKATNSLLGIGQAFVVACMPGSGCIRSTNNVNVAL
jgi:hypothetical protein